MAGRTPVANHENSLSRICHTIYSASEFTDQLILIFGFLMITQPSDCKEMAYHLYNICMQIICVRFFVWMAPLMLLSCMFCSFGTLFYIVSKYKKWKDKRRLQEALDRVPKYKYKANSPETKYGSITIQPGYEDCVICMAGYEDQNYIRVLPCNHHFHQECIDQWICLTPKCPLCKRSVDPMLEDLPV